MYDQAPWVVRLRGEPMPAITAALLSSYAAYKFSNLQIALAVFIAGFGAALLVSWIRSGMIARDPEMILALGMERFDLVPMRYRIERRLVGWLVPPAVGYVTFQLLTNMLVPNGGSGRDCLCTPPHLLGGDGFGAMRFGDGAARRATPNKSPWRGTAALVQ